MIGGVLVLAGVSLCDLFFVRCDEKVPYCQKMRKVMQNVGVAEISTKVVLML